MKLKFYTSFFTTIVTVGLIFLLCHHGSSAKKDASKEWIKVFHIERSLNANICVYEVRVITSTSSAIFDVTEPIKIYWIMYTKKGIIEPLTVIEEKLAYGIKISTVTENKIKFFLKSLPKREIEVRFFKDEDKILKPKAVIKLNDEDSIIEKIYVESKQKFPLPKVLYVEVTGRSIKTGEMTIEKIIPAKEK